jgi:hypothetical protein
VSGFDTTLACLPARAALAETGCPRRPGPEERGRCQVKLYAPVGPRGARAARLDRDDSVVAFDEVRVDEVFRTTRRSLVAGERSLADESDRYVAELALDGFCIGFVE